MRQHVDYREVQRLAPWVFVLLGVFVLAGIILLVVQIGMGRPVGDQPVSNTMLIVMFVIFSLTVPSLLLTMKLDIETTFEGVHVRYGFLLNRWIRYEDIQSAVAKTYSPMREFGGWGIRGFGKRVAYNASGNEGVLLTLKDGATIMLGSRRAPELEAAIKSGMRA